MTAPGRMQGEAGSPVTYGVVARAGGRLAAARRVGLGHVFLTRKQSEPPKWMGRLERANPRLSFRLGFLLLGGSPPTS